MPKQTPPVADDSDIDSWLKGRGYDFNKPKTPTPAPTPKSKPGEVEAAPASPATGDEDPGYLSQIGSALREQPAMFAEDARSIGRGLGKSAASLGEGAVTLAGQVLPGSVRRTLGQLASQIPGVEQARQFGREPYENFTEGVAGVGGDIAATMMMPELRLGSLAARAVPASRVQTATNVVMPTFSRTPSGAMTATMAPQLVTSTRAVQNPTAVRAARAAGGAAEAAIKGGVGGAVADPDDQGTGAKAGAEEAVAQRALGAALASRYGSRLSGVLMRYVPAGILGTLIGHVTPVGAEMGGLGGLLAHGGWSGLRHTATGSVGHYHGPIGEQLDRLGRGGATKIGRGARYTAPAGGTLTGRAVSGEPAEGEKTDLNPYTEQDYRGSATPQAQ